MTCDYALSAAAEEDLIDIFEWTLRTFGPQAKVRYEALIAAALDDIAEDPFRAGSRTHPLLSADMRKWHLRSSIRRGGAHPASASHAIFYRVERPDFLAVMRILHDTMDVRRGLRSL